MSRALILSAETHEFERSRGEIVSLPEPRILLVWEDVDKSAKHRVSEYIAETWKQDGLPDPVDLIGHLIDLPLLSETIKVHWEEEVNRKQQPVLAIDFDGVIAEYHGWKGDRHFGEPLPGVIDAIRRIKKAGWWVTIWTTREPVGVWQYCTKRGIPVDGINSVVFRNWTQKKIVADVYLDDRGMNFSGHWDIGMIEKILDFHPYWEDLENPESFEPVTNTGMAEAVVSEIARCSSVG